MQPLVNLLHLADVVQGYLLVILGQK